jgi:hypothetical protein
MNCAPRPFALLMQFIHSFSASFFVFFSPSLPVKIPMTGNVKRK